MCSKPLKGQGDDAGFGAQECEAERSQREHAHAHERQHGGSLHETRPFLHKKTRRLIFRGRSLQQQFEQPKKTAGQGGQSSAGQTGPVGLSDSKGVAMQQQQMAMGLQLAQIASQIKVNESVAEKNNAEAEKTAGADTEVAKAQAKLNKRLTSLQDTVEEVMNSQEQLNAANYFKVQAEEKRVWEEVRELVRNNEIGDATKEEAIAKVGIENWNRIIDGFETIARTKLSEEKIQNLKGMLAVAWANVAIGEKTVSNQADHIANELMMGLQDLDRKERELLKDWIYEGVHAGKEISGEILNWLTRGIGKNITEITGRLEELFDENGNLTGTKQIQQTVTKTKK